MPPISKSLSSSTSSTMTESPYDENNPDVDAGNVPDGTPDIENRIDHSSGLKSLPLKLPCDPLDDATAAADDEPVLPPPPSSPSEGDDASLGRGKRIKFPNHWIYDGKSRCFSLGSLARISTSSTASPLEPILTSVGVDRSLAPISTSSTASPLELILTSVGVDPFTCEVDYWHPMTWFAAMEKETYTITDRIQLPEGHPDINSTWVIQVKRKPDGTSTKKKARFCAQGDIQELNINELVYSFIKSIL